MQDLQLMSWLLPPELLPGHPNSRKYLPPLYKRHSWIPPALAVTMGRRRAADSAGNLQAGGRPCFFPDGTLVGDFPCFPEADESMCCWANHTCMSNGYCRFPDNDMPGQMRYIRGSCTDRECAKFQFNFVRGLSSYLWG